MGKLFFFSAIFVQYKYCGSNLCVRFHGKIMPDSVSTKWHTIIGTSNFFKNEIFVHSYNPIYIVLTFIILVCDSPPGVYLYLGYSKKDLRILKQGRVKLGKPVPDTEDDERYEVRNTVQQMVSHFNSNTKKVILRKTYFNILVTWHNYCCYGAVTAAIVKF